VQRFRLENGLRVVLAPDRSVPVVAVTVSYDVGMRNEPQGRTGFAHLFEHLMFQGSANVPKMEHARLVQAAGGTFNGSTHQDYTNYYEALPARPSSGPCSSRPTAWRRRPSPRRTSATRSTW
jgi:Predicted Zn-dependent peptidases